MVKSLRNGWRRLVRAVARRVDCAGESGQSATEYTLVLLVAATVALLLLNWVKGGAVTAFFDNIFTKVTGMFS